MRYYFRIINSQFLIMDRLRSMEVFVAVIDTGGFSAAGRLLKMSNVMVGKHIAELETRMGARLLNRTTRRQSLTEIGAHYCEQCRQILSQIKLAERGADVLRQAPRGLLKVSAPVAFGSESLAPALAIYLENNPDVCLDLELSNRVPDLVEQGLDAAIRTGHLEDSNLVARALRPYRNAICASPAYLERYGTPQSPADFLHHQCLDFSHWKRHLKWRLSPESPLETVPPCRFRSNNGQALKQAALAGLGITMQAEIVLREEIQRGRLVSIMEDFIAVPRPMHLVYPRDLQPTPKLTTFIEFVLAHFGAWAPE
jgi:DNA-binding transcriptional LysR family regulator